MDLPEPRAPIFTLLKDIYSVSSQHGSKSYIWAGLVQDVLAGRLLREHGDVDAFTLNLWELKDRLVESYRQKGYTVSWVDEVDFLRVEIDGVHAVFNQLELDGDGDTALWRHAGLGGTVYFPARWLPAEPCPFYGTRVFISGIEFEYAIKSHPELLNPLWKGREKDRAALAWLEGRLDEKRIDRENLLAQVWSYNPYWVKKGYDAYRMPCVARTLEPIKPNPDERENEF